MSVLSVGRALRPALVCCVLLLLALPTSARAQSSQTGVLAGQVLGPDGQPVPGVSVFARRNGVNLALRAVTDADGRFAIAGVPVPGTYQVMCAIGSLTEAGPTVDLTAASLPAPVEVRLKLGVAEEVSVTADTWTLPVEPPNSVVSRTFDQLRQQNLINPEDAIRNLPSTTIRKRYIGDRNALIGGRSFGTLQPSRALVYLDGYLLSNFLGRFDAPRWNMVVPEALERVDVLYGPFSAVHAGNSIGTTVVMTERAPRALEWGARFTSGSQRFSDYADSGTFGSGQVSLYAGGRAKSGLWASAAYNHQDSTSHPMQWYTISANAAGQFPATSGAAKPVSGVLYDTDPNGARRAILGANSGAIDHTKQDSVKVRAGYLIRGVVDASVMIGAWRNDTANRNTTFLRDAAGTPVWQGVVTDGTSTFNVPASTFAPSTRDESHAQVGLTMRTRRASGWNASFIVSDYRILTDASRLAAAPEPLAVDGGAGTVTRRDGTGWGTTEVQFSRTSAGSGRHTVTFGVHRNAYRLANDVNNSDDWRQNETTLNQRYGGRTSVKAFYVQDVVALADRLKLTAGWRAEWFDAWNGLQIARLSSCTASGAASCESNGDGTFNKVFSHAARSLSGQSPKVSLTWLPTDRVVIRTSFGRGVRFPNVEELYNGTVTATSVTVSDPSLKAERSNAVEVSAETFWTKHMLRSTFFLDDVRDAILRQLNLTVTPTITNISNVDRVRTPGLEFVWVGQDLPFRRLNLEANVTVADSKVVANSKDPDSVGKYWLRVPKTRASLVAAFRPTAKWMTSVGIRHQGRAYNDVYNRDVNPNVYGGVSSINQIDLRASFKPESRVELAVGVDNVTDSRAYVAHPYPRRTFFAELRLASR